MDKAKRLNNIFGKDGKTIIVALDGFGFSANTDGVDFSVKSVHQLLKYGLNCALVRLMFLTAAFPKQHNSSMSLMH